MRAKGATVSPDGSNGLAPQSMTCCVTTTPAVPFTARRSIRQISARPSRTSRMSPKKSPLVARLRSGCVNPPRANANSTSWTSPALLKVNLSDMTRSPFGHVPSGTRPFVGLYSLLGYTDFRLCHSKKFPRIRPFLPWQNAQVSVLKNCFYYTSIL